MVFSSFSFLFGFLPIFLVSYYLTPVRFRNIVALLFSYVFYAWGGPRVVVILFISSIIDYYLCKTGNVSSKRRPVFLLAIFLNVALLIYFKYTNFFLTEVNTLLASFGLKQVAFAEIALPIGISFFTFQKISYLADVYYRRCSAADRLSDYLLYVALFPQLIAGPIVRYHDIAAQLRARRCDVDTVFSGIVRFCFGLGKKILIADEMGRVADNVFALSETELSAPVAWVGLVAYALQIYFDFSGYSDMAIGLGRMMGFHFLENFNFPYISQNITEFWRRWHISLSRWMKEYLYIPLGGNRGSTFRTYCNLWIVFVISGIWHGASWTFLFWGVYHGFFLVLDRLFWLKLSKGLPKIINAAICFLIVSLGWVFFRTDSFAESIEFFKALFGFNGRLAEPGTLYRQAYIHNRAVFVMTVSLIGSLFPMWQKAVEWINQRWKEAPQTLQAGMAAGLSFTVLFLAILSLAANRFSPFLYFRF